MRFLVTGGAGYIGSHVTQSLLENGHEVVVLDNLSTGHLSAIPFGAKFEHADLMDYPTIERILTQNSYDVVMHFAALSLVGDSIKYPYHYLRTNTLASLNLIEACTKCGVSRFIFSSTAALFSQGNLLTPISDTTTVKPSSPYGESKYIIERALKWANHLHGLKSASLRYFNAAGADPQGRLGEDHRPETHLIPLAIDALLERRLPLQLFGNDYPTRDGSCIRDYIHVTDLADAHIRVIQKLDEKNILTYNLGNGQGFSNLEVIQSIERVSGKKVPWQWAPRRQGDPASLIADSSLFRKETNWNPAHSELDIIIETALKWRINHPFGYKD